METIKAIMVDVLKDKLDEYEGNMVFCGDLGYELLQQYNVDGSYTYDTSKAIEWVKMHFEEFEDILTEMKEVGIGSVAHVFENPEAFQVQIMLFVASDLLGQCKTVDECWNDEIILDKDIIDKIKEELDNL